MIQITIPKKCLTINHLYGQRGFRKFIKQEGKELREYIIKLIQNRKHNDNLLIPLNVSVEIYENWLTKEGFVKRKDLDNRAKFLLDSVFLGLGSDDKYIFQLTMRKIQSKIEKSVIKINKLEV